jgi:hypothetical protein
MEETTPEVIIDLIGEYLPKEMIDEYLTDKEEREKYENNS